MSEERLQKLHSHLQLAKNIASQNQNPQQDHLISIKQIWDEQEKLMFDTDEIQPTMQEVLIDLKVIENTGCYVGQYIKTLQASATAFCPSDYAGKLMEWLNENGVMQWCKLTDVALPIINRAPGVSVMLGTFKPTNQQVVMVEKKRRTATRNKNEILEKQTAEHVENIQQDDESVDYKVNHVLKTLRTCYERNGRHPVQFYRFVLHPTDFTTTVENVFYISFIIRDGSAALGLIEEEFVISPIEVKRDPCDKIEKNQMIFSITWNQWKKLVTQYGIQRPQILWNSNS